MPKSFFEDHHADGDDPGHQQRGGQVPRAGGHVGAEEVLAGTGEQVALGHQHSGEEDQQQDLGELGRLNTEAGGEPDPDLGAVGLGEMGGQERRDRQQDKADQAAGVSVAGQDAVVFEEHHNQGEAEHADEGPQHLLLFAGPALRGGDRTADQIEAVNHHQAKSVEQCDNWQQHRVGVGGEPPDGQVRADEQCEEGQRRAGQIPTDALLLVRLHDQQATAVMKVAKHSSASSALRRVGVTGAA